MIEESEERLTDMQVKEILQIIAQNFRHVFKVKDEDDLAGDQAQD